jgi:predicted glycoside hydrolase/deacetylase ChbG (UPF0249 family)
MVRWRPACVAAARISRAYPRLSVGLHLDFGEWQFREGAWTEVYRVVSTDDGDAIAAETTRQLESFRRLVRRDPTHLDTHQHLHRREPVRSVLKEMARGLSIPLRECHPKIEFRGDFYGQNSKGIPCAEKIGIERLLEIISALPQGVAELSCHPGKGIDAWTTYGKEREQELNVLCDPRVRAAIEAHGVELISFAEAFV